MARAEESPWKLGGLPLKELAGRVWAEIWDDEVSDRAAALSYYFLFALFPALLFLTALLGLLPLEGLMDRLMGYVAQALPGDAVSIIRKTLDEIVAGARGGLLSIGVLAALWAGSNGMASVISALNVAYDAADRRPWWKRRLVAIGLTFGFSVFIIAAMVLMVFGPKIGGVVAGRLGLGELFTLVWNIASIPVVIALVLVGLAVVYYFAPAVERRWRWVTPGSATALALWLAMSYGLRLYVQGFGSYGATYGSIAGVILLMLWLYLTGVVLLLGAEIDSEIAHAAVRRGSGTPPSTVSVAAETAARRGWTSADHVRPIQRAPSTAPGVERWLPVAGLAMAVLLGLRLSRRPVSEVAEAGNRAVERSLQVADAVAALERFRSQRGRGAKAA